MWQYSSTRHFRAVLSPKIVLGSPGSQNEKETRKPSKRPKQTTQRWPPLLARTYAAPSNNRMQRPQFAGQQQQQYNSNFSMNSAQQQFQQQEAAGSPGGLGPGGPAPPQQMMHLDPEDPLLIAQSLTYVTDDGSVNLSFASAPFSFCKWSYLAVSCLGR